MSASPDNRSSDILFLRYDLIRCKLENERSASAELTGRVQPIISKTRMLGYISSSAYFTHSIRFPGSCKVGVYYFQKYCHSFNSERREDGVGIKNSTQTAVINIINLRIIYINLTFRMYTKRQVYI